ncbi:MAG: adenylosuccinate synthase [Flavobacteriales bacterium]
MKADVLLGLQWGDEGKGKIVDVLSPGYDIIARFQGGPNAGHTLKFNDIKHVLHTVPSGIFREGVSNLVGNGVVIDPVIMQKEVSALRKIGVPVEKRLLISRKAHLILPTHRLLDAASEQSKGSDKIGSTLKGIGPAYMDKTGRNGLRVGDIDMPDFQDACRHLTEKHMGILQRYRFELPEDFPAMQREWMEAVAELKKLHFVDSEYYIDRERKAGKKILAEGAQGALLDIDFGSYPFVTSSSTLCAGACTGLGLPPSGIGEVYGIFKAYCTRVGSGPFPTELQDKTGKWLQDKGNEFGATTGRPRRCGWLDLPALKYSVMLSGVTKLCMMKADVLAGMHSVSVCTHYICNGEKTDRLPYSIRDGLPEPVYKVFPGWQETETNIPGELLSFIEFIEEALGIPVSILSVGPDRSQTIIRHKAPA